MVSEKNSFLREKKMQISGSRFQDTKATRDDAHILKTLERPQYRVLRVINYPSTDQLHLRREGSH